jgi:hypothetical protein
VYSVEDADASNLKRVVELRDHRTHDVVAVYVAEGRIMDTLVGVVGAAAWHRVAVVM